jgi:hypothetical protein
MLRAAISLSIGLGCFLAGLYVATNDQFALAGFLVSVANTYIIAGYWQLGHS